VTKPKISEDQAQELLKIVRYALDEHEWCEYPVHVDPRCGTGHSAHCDSMKEDPQMNDRRQVPCRGCRMAAKAEKAAKWRLPYDREPLPLYPGWGFDPNQEVKE